MLAIRPFIRPAVRPAVACAIDGIGRGSRSLDAAIRALFAAGEQGAWYDRSDLSSQYQDATGTLALTTAGQPVGLALDKKLVLVPGPDLITNGTFDIDASGWASGPNATIAAASGEAVLSGTGTNAYARTTITTVAGRFYTIRATARCGTSSHAQIRMATGSAVFTTSATNVALSNTFLATASTSLIDVLLGTAGTGIFDNISLRELPGSHASQATAPARPQYQTGPARLVYDGVDDVLVTTFPSALGSNCTVVRSIPGVGAQILTGQTIGTSYADSTTNCGLLIVNRSLTAAETATATRWANLKAGV